MRERAVARGAAVVAPGRGAERASGSAESALLAVFRRRWARIVGTPTAAKYFKDFV